MPVNLSIKNAPEDVVDRLKRRAAKNHRSLQGELMAIIEAAAKEEALDRTYLTPKEVLAKARRLGISTLSSSVDIIRADRDHEH